MYKAGIETLFWPAINFVLYVGLISYVVKRSINPALSRKAEAVSQKIYEVAQEVSRAEQNLRVLEARRQGVSQEITLIKQHLAEETRRMLEEVLTAGEIEEKNVFLNVEKKLSREKLKAQAELREKILFGASKKAREIAVSKLTSADNSRFCQEVIARI